MVAVQRIWLIASETSEDGGARVSLRQKDSGDLALVLGPIGSTGQLGGAGGQEREVDLDVARALGQAILEACEVATALQEP